MIDKDDILDYDIFFGDTRGVIRCQTMYSELVIISSLLDDCSKKGNKKTFVYVQHLMKVLKGVQ